jgi:alcohol dehydrogenase class IV
MSTTGNAFSFSTVGTLLVEWQGAARLDEIVARHFTAQRILLVTDPGLVNSGALAPAEEALRRGGYAVTRFDRVVADPPAALALQAAAAAREAHCDLVIGFGGGSSLDVAKIAAALAPSQQPLDAMYGIDKVTGSRLPLMQIPTTAGTGSEVTNIAILTTGENSKMGVVAPQLFSDLVLLDAHLTLGLPPLHTAAAAIDAMVHAIEAYTSAHKKNPLSDALAREALRLISRHLLRACHHGADREAREAVLFGAMLAGQAFTNAPVAAVHALAYPLGGRYHVPHGLSNALMLIPVLHFNAPAAAPLYAELAAAIGLPVSGDAQRDTARFIAELTRLIVASGAPQRLRDVGVEETQLPLLARDAMQQTRLLINNPLPLSESDALRLYQQVF